MNNLQFARAQMGLSLAFHIVFAAVGIAMPVMMAIAEGLHLRNHNPVYLELARRWARGTAILFAVGAVSGTVLSFQLVGAAAFGMDEFVCPHHPGCVVAARLSSRARCGGRAGGHDPSRLESGPISKSSLSGFDHQKFSRSGSHVATPGSGPGPR